MKGVHMNDKRIKIIQVIILSIVFIVAMFLAMISTKAIMLGDTNDHDSTFNFNYANDYDDLLLTYHTVDGVGNITQIKLDYNVGSSYIIINIPSDTSFYESQTRSISIDDTFIRNHTAGSGTDYVYYMSKYNLFTFSKETYDFYIDTMVYAEERYEVGYDDGYNAGAILANEAVYDAGKNGGILIGREQMYNWGSQYYDFDVNNSKDYIYGLYDGINSVTPLIDTNNDSYDDRSWNAGRTYGQGENIEDSFGLGSILSLVFGDFIGAFLAIEIIPGIEIGYFVLVPLVFGIISFILSLGKKK
jgi:hypothetical protein